MCNSCGKTEEVDDLPQKHSCGNTAQHLSHRSRPLLVASSDFTYI